MSEISITNVYGKVDKNLETELIELWNNPDGITDSNTINQRLKEVYAISRTAEGVLVGVSTIYAELDPILKENMYYIRAYVAESHRKQFHIATGLSNYTADTLDAAYDPQDTNACKGLVTVIENPALKKYFNFAKVPHADAFFYGYDPQDNPCRVYYFSGAKIA